MRVIFEVDTDTQCVDEPYIEAIEPRLCAGHVVILARRDQEHGRAIPLADVRWTG